MKTRNRLLTLLALCAGAAATTAVINKWIKVSAVSKNLLSEPQSLCYKWRFGNIHYTKTGTGKPLLLIHDLKASASSYEWNLLIGHLKDSYTVYAIDLLGCGRSDKPDLTYTNYLYVQLLSDFIKSEVGHRTDVIATGGSASIAVMACNNSPELFDRLMLVNPESILSCSQIPGKYAWLYKLILDLPIIGTLCYHIAVSKNLLEEDFTNEYFYNQLSIRNIYIDSYFEAAHLGFSPKSLYASVKCNYTKCNVTNALKKVDNSIYIVGGSARENITELIEEYKQYNSAIEYSMVPNTKQLPQLENPAALLNIIKMYFS